MVTSKVNKEKSDINYSGRGYIFQWAIRTNTFLFAEITPCHWSLGQSGRNPQEYEEACIPQIQMAMVRKTRRTHCFKMLQHGYGTKS